MTDVCSAASARKQQLLRFSITADHCSRLLLKSCKRAVKERARHTCPRQYEMKKKRWKGNEKHLVLNEPIVFFSFTIVLKSCKGLNMTIIILFQDHLLLICTFFYVYAMHIFIYFNIDCRYSLALQENVAEQERWK